MSTAASSSSSACSGEPIHDTPHRLTVQARQIHTYAVAQKRGWYRAGDKIEQAYRSMLRDYRRERNWAFSVHRNGEPCDPRRDFYAHAFVLLAIGSLVGLTGDRAPLAVADELLACLDTDFGAPEGHLEALPVVAGPRRQNPHMHLFEALLNLWMNTRDPRYLERAGKIFDLFERRFFDPKAGVLLEYFDDALAPAAERIVEPGHHCEWAWLLRWYQRETGTPVEHYVEPLLAHVERHGIDPVGLLPDELLADGTVRTASRRTWPMTEAIKAFAVHGRHGEGGSAGRPPAHATSCPARRPAAGWTGSTHRAGPWPTTCRRARSITSWASWWSSTRRDAWPCSAARA